MAKTSNINYKLFVFIILFSVLLTSCASTKITSYIDPDYKSTKFNKILIVVNSDRLDYRVKIEEKLSAVFWENGIFSNESYLVLPPTKEFTDSQKADVVLSKKIDGYLVINYGESEFLTQQLPISGSNAKGKSDGSKYKTTYIGGEVLRFPDFELKLYDVQTGNLAWMANSSTVGGGLASFNTIYNSVCNKIADDLIKADLILTSKFPKIKDIEKSGDKGTFVFVVDREEIKGKFLSFERNRQGLLFQVTIEDTDGNIIPLKIEKIKKFYKDL